MSYLKYMKTQKKRRKSFKQRKSAVFPDGDESDSSENSTFYDVCHHSSTSSSYSEHASIESESRNINQKRMKSGKLNKGSHDDILKTMNAFSLADRPHATTVYNVQRESVTSTTHSEQSSKGSEVFRKFSAECDDSVFVDFNTFSKKEKSNKKRHVSKKTITTTTIDIQITTPETGCEERRPSHTEKRADKTGRYSSTSEENTNDVESKYDCFQPSKDFLTSKLPSIDVISPSPTLSIYSDRNVLTNEQFGSLLSPTLSRLSGRTLTPLSSLSSSSTMSDSFSLTSGPEDCVQGNRPLLPKKKVLPPIKKTHSLDSKTDIGLPHLGKKNKNDRKTIQTTRSLGEYSGVSSDGSVTRNNKVDGKKTGLSLSERLEAAALRREYRTSKKKKTDISKTKHVDMSTMKQGETSKVKQGKTSKAQQMDISKITREEMTNASDHKIKNKESSTMSHLEDVLPARKEKRKHIIPPRNDLIKSCNLFPANQRTSASNLKPLLRRHKQDKMHFLGAGTIPKRQ